MDAAELRARLVGTGRNSTVSAAPRWVPDAPALDDRPVPGGAAPVPAAVLVPVLLGTAPGVLLTKRTVHLSHHPGQVAFPGGRIDAGDDTPEAAALREAQEEIGLAPERVELAGRLNDHITGTGYKVTPVLGLLQPGDAAGLDLQLSPHEVEAVFELPLAVLLDPAAPRLRRARFNGRWREFWVWPHPEQYIWGATAAILVQLANRLRRAE